MVILIVSDGDYDKLVLLEGVDEKVSIDFSNVNIDDWLCGRTIWLLSQSEFYISEDYNISMDDDPGPISASLGNPCNPNVCHGGIYVSKNLSK